MTNPIAGNAGKIFVRDVELDLEPFSTTDSATWVISDLDGDTLSSGTLTYTAALMVNGLTASSAWEADIVWPVVPQDVLVTMSIIKDGSLRDWRFRVTVGTGIP